MKKNNKPKKGDPIVVYKIDINKEEFIGEEHIVKVFVPLYETTIKKIHEELASVNSWTYDIIKYYKVELENGNALNTTDDNWSICGFDYNEACNVHGFIGNIEGLKAYNKFINDSDMVDRLCGRISNIITNCDMNSGIDFDGLKNVLTEEYYKLLGV